MIYNHGFDILITSAGGILGEYPPSPLTDLIYRWNGGVMGNRICSVEDCYNTYYGLGYCKKHYMRVGKYGDPLSTKRNVDNDGICSIEDCDNLYHALGYCNKHYKKFKQYRDPLYVKPKKVCCIENCNNKAIAKGYCRKHYIKFKNYGNPLHTITEQHGMWNTPEYKAWVAMIQRCTNSNNKGYHYYGGRGIMVCDRWRKSFIAFFKDMGERPFLEAQIDREKNNLGYYKENCRWVTSVVNSQNQRTTKLTMEKAREIRNSNLSKKELSLIYGVCEGNIGRIISNKIWKEMPCENP